MAKRKEIQMLRMATTTKLTPEEAIKQAVKFFGPEGYRLEIKDQSPTCAYFEGAGGQVEVTSCTDEKGTSVELVSQEWDYLAREFLRKIAHSAEKKLKKK
jgi:hypothetical protein